MRWPSIPVRHTGVAAGLDLPTEHAPADLAEALARDPGKPAIDPKTPAAASFINVLRDSTTHSQKLGCTFYFIVESLAILQGHSSNNRSAPLQVETADHSLLSYTAAKWHGGEMSAQPSPPAFRRETSHKDPPNFSEGQMGGVAAAPATDGGHCAPLHICEQNLNTASGIPRKRPNPTHPEFPWTV